MANDRGLIQSDPSFESKFEAYYENNIQLTSKGQLQVIQSQHRNIRGQMEVEKAKLYEINDKLKVATQTSIRKKTRIH